MSEHRSAEECEKLIEVISAEVARLVTMERQARYIDVDKAYYEQAAERIMISYSQASEERIKELEASRDALKDALISARSMVEHQRTLLEKRGYVDIQFLASDTIKQIEDALAAAKKEPANE